MADPATEPDAPTGRRHRRDERRRRRIRRVVAIVAGTAVFAAFVLVATDTVRFGGDDRPSLAATVQAVGTDDTRPTSSTAPAARQCRTLSVDDPLRVWVGGDSLAGSLGPAFGTIAGATGVVQPYFDSRVSSGLSSPGFFDWPEHATAEMARIDPEVVVFIIGANDWTAVSGDTWKADYAQAVDSMMKTLIGPGRTVYWVGSPTLKDEKMDAAVVEVNAVAQEVAKHHPKVHYVDAYKLYSGTDGKYAGDLPDETGEVVTMRAGRRCAPDHGRRRLPGAQRVPARRHAVRGDRAEGRRRGQADDRERGQHAGRAELGLVVGRVRFEQRRRHHPDDPARTRADRAADDAAARARHRTDDRRATSADDHDAAARVEPVIAGARR